jgi:hypothetical protein
VRKLWASGIGAGWCGWGGFRREICGGASVLVIAGRRKGGETTEGWSSAGSYRASTTPLEERRGRGGDSGHGPSPRRRAASVSLSAWQLLGSGSPTWHGEGKTAGRIRAVEGMTRRCVGEGSKAADARGQPAAEGTRARQGKQRSSGTRGGR